MADQARAEGTNEAARDLREQVEVLLRLLPERERAVLECVSLRRLDIPAAANDRQLSTAATYKRHARGLQRLVQFAAEDKGLRDRIYGV